MFKSYVYLKSGRDPIGEVEVYPQGQNMINSQREFQIAYFTTFHNKQCSPLGALQTFGSGCLCFKMKCKDEAAKLVSIHTTCLTDKQTAVIQEEHDDIHLVAMKSRKNPSTGSTRSACFWGFKVSRSLFSTCLAMLKQRCLAVVFSLDETIVVANTARTFEDKINSLKCKLSCESDPLRLSGLKAQIERYRQDLLILEQYAEDDQVGYNGKVYKVQLEVVPSLHRHLSGARPVIRLLEGIILTRINPSKRETSVLVRIRPGWEKIRSFLSFPNDLRPFDVYVCTMADYFFTMEMWRLLDPQFELIASSQLHNRVVYAKASSKKSLHEIFYYSQCHPKLALVIDSSLDVWDEKDQPKVHVIPTFSPYSAPEKSTNNTPLLDVRTVASNVSRAFFRDFDGVFLFQIDEVFYEDESANLPSAPDVENYLTSMVNLAEHDDALAFYEDPLAFDGMADDEADDKLKETTTSLGEENNDSENIDLSQPCDNGSNLALVPVKPGSSGKGLPYAPENWPKNGDVWTWRVGQRVTKSGYCADRYLCPPERYTKGKLVFSSRLSVEEFVKKEFPGVDVDSFFATFSWRIPCIGRGLTRLDKEYKTITELPSPNPIPELELEPEPKPDSPIPEGLCKARNRTCNLRKEQQMQAEITLESEPFPCDICCSEPGFCRECCCILCGKAVDWTHNSHAFIRCMATVNSLYVCGHGAHIICALRCFMAGTVGGSICLDSEYYCRWCDNRMDLVPHVVNILKVCRSVGSREEAMSVLDLGLCALSGSRRAVGRKLHDCVDFALSMIKNGAALDEIFIEDWISSIDSSVKNLHEEDHTNMGPPLELDSNFKILPRKRKGYDDDDDETTMPLKKKENISNGSGPHCRDLSFSSLLQAEKEVNRVLLDLKKEQEEYKIVEEKLLSQKDHLFGLYQVLKSERADLDDPIVRQFNNAETYNALVSRVNARADEVKQQEEKLQGMLGIAEEFIQARKMLREHFGELSDSLERDVV